MGLDAKPASLHLDEQLLRFMDQLEVLEGKREKMNSLIEQGWFSITKARYSMGNKQVSPLQYASEMTPLVHIHSRVENGKAEFQVERTEHKTEELKEYAGAVEDIGPKEEGLRRRINTQQKETKEEKPSEGQLRKASPSSVKAEQSQPQHQDPLKWFGILVPQNLKQAQAAFKEVIELSAEIAALQSAVLSTRAELQAQMREKLEKIPTGSTEDRHTHTPVTVVSQPSDAGLCQ